MFNFLLYQCSFSSFQLLLYCFIMQIFDIFIIIILCAVQCTQFQKIFQVQNIFSELLKTAPWDTNGISCLNPTTFTKCIPCYCPAGVTYILIETTYVIHNYALFNLRNIRFISTGLICNDVNQICKRNLFNTLSDKPGT